MIFNRLLIVIGAITLAACAAPHQCPLGYECLNAGDALNAARQNGGNSETVLPHDGNYKRIGEQTEQDNKRNSETSKIALSGKSVMRGQPVYIPDSPMRVTVMPTNAGDVMIGAHEIYFPIPGGFSIGINEGPSVRTGKFFSPIDPNKQLGFNPVESQDDERVMPLQ